VSLVLVTDLSGVGYSSVYRRLVEFGFDAFGFDEDGFGEWLDRKSGLRVALPTDRHDSGDAADLRFTVHRDKIEELARRSGSPAAAARKAA
jgi:hypothetical protein